MAILKSADPRSIIFDPFCGRGTTNFAAQTRGMTSYGFDASPIAVVIARAKLANTDIESVMNLVDEILDFPDVEVPVGEFWELAFHPSTLRDICKLRAYLPRRKEADDVVMLKAIALGCLHGPLTKDLKSPSYFSNQMPRTFSSKPNYSVGFWRRNSLKPNFVDIRIPIRKKAEMVLKYVDTSDSRTSNIICTDSRKPEGYESISAKIDLVISSPPYYGMQTYVQDQWLRNWFLGGPEHVDYDTSKQLSHASPDAFSKSLTQVWDNILNIASPNIKLALRFGGLSSRKGNYDSIIRDSFDRSNAK